MQIRFGTLLLYALLAAGFDYAQAEQSAEKRHEAAAFIANGLSKSVGWNRKEATRALGRPTKVLIEARANAYIPEVVDSISSLHFKGAIIRYFVPGRGIPSKEFAIEAEVTSPDIELGQGLKIGDKLDKVKLVLGDPSTFSEDSLVYESDELQEKAVLYFKKRV